MMISYRAVSAWLGGVGHVARIARTYQERVGPLPEGRLGEMEVMPLIRRILDTVSFPVHEHLLWDYEDYGGDEAVGSFPMWEFVCFQGLDADRMWMDWDDGFKVALCVLEAGPRERDVEWVYTSEAEAWWNERAERYGLAPWKELDQVEMVMRLAELPAPWHGLGKILDWAEGDTGYYFVDIPCNYVNDMAMDDFDWSAETLARLEEDYRRAEAEVLGPASDVVDLCRDNEEAVEVAMKLAAGYPVEWVIQDGEVMVMRYEQV